MRDLATVTSDGLNLHKEPHATSAKTDVLTKGDTITVGHYGTGNWLYGTVSSGSAHGKSGWIDRRFVSIKPIIDSPMPPQIPPPKPSYTISALVIGFCVAIMAALLWLFGR